MRFLRRKQLEDFYTKVIMPSVTYGLTMDSVGSYNKTHINNLEKLHARAGRIIYELPWGTSADGVLTRTGWDSLETMYKLRLAEFFFKCIKGYLKSFLQRNLGRRRNENIMHSSKTRNEFSKKMYTLYRINRMGQFHEQGNQG